MNLICITAAYDAVRYMEIQDWLDEHTPNWVLGQMTIATENWTDNRTDKWQIEYRFTQPEHAIMFTLRWI